MQILRTKSLSYLIASPPTPAAGRNGLPVLCFLHGLREAAPLEIRKALTLHGPLCHRNTCRPIQSFVVVAPQLPSPRSRWRDHVDDVIDIVGMVQRGVDCDAERASLTGFSYGADGIFEVAGANPGLWRALWAVDPTRVPSRAPMRPTWLSLGEMSRALRCDFERRLGVRSQADGGLGDFVCEDRGLDHVGTATAAYRDEKIYQWLLG
jgi:hypothetical protein